MVNYSELLEKSYKSLKENYVLFTPIIISLGLFIVFAILFAVELGILFMILSNKGTILKVLTVSTFLASPFTLGLTLFFIVIDILILYALSSYIKGMYYGMYKEIVKTGTTSIDTMYKGGKELWIPFFKFSLIITALFLAPIVLVYLSFFIDLKLTILLGVLSLVYYFVFSFGILFSQPMIAIKKEPVWEIIKESLRYARDNKSHVLLTGVIVFGIYFVINIVLIQFQKIPTIGSGFVVLTPIIMAMIGVFIGLFIFYSYKTNPK